jgi:hypothetical protein
MLSASVVGLLLGAVAVAPATAQDGSSSDLKPVVAVSFSGVDAVKADLQRVAKASGTEELLTPLLNEVQGFPGLDATKPWGAVVLTDGAEFSWYVFVPVSDLDELLAKVKSLPQAPPIPEPDADGIYVIDGPDGQMQFFIQEKQGWVFVASSRATLAGAPADPVPTLEGLDESYTFAVRFTVKNISSEIRSQVLMAVQFGMMAFQTRQPGESDQEYNLRTQMAEQSLEQFTRLVEDTDAVLIGLGVDAESKAVHLDIEFTAVEGTPTAEEFASLGGAKTNLAGFCPPEAAAAIQSVGKMAESDAAMMKDLIDTYGSKALDEIDEQALADGERKVAKQMIQDLIDVANATIEKRKNDMGLSILGDSESLHLILGVYVAEATKLEDVFKRLVGLASQENPAIAQLVKLNAAEHRGVRLHTVSVPAVLLEDAELPPQIAGDSLNLVVGFEDEHFYAAGGPNAMDVLKQAIDRSKDAAGQSVAPFTMTASATAWGHILEGLAAQGVIDDDVGKVAVVLKEAGENDHVSITGTAIPNGMRVRIQAEAGILKSIGSLVKMAMLGAGAAPGRVEF